MQYIFFLAVAPTAAAISLAVAGYALRHRYVPGASGLALYMLSASGFLIGNTLELLWPTEAGTLFWAQLNYLFIASIPLTWLVFVFQYIGRESELSPRRLLAFGVIPVVTCILAVTNSFHHLIWRSYTFHPVGNMLALSVSYGPWFWVYSFYAYTLLLGGAGLIISAHLAGPRLYRWRSAWVVAGAVVPLIFNIFYVFHLIPLFQKDYTPLAFALSGIAFAIGILRYHLLDLLPAARATLIEQMHEGVIVVDSADRIIDMNPAARHMLGLEETAIGKPLTIVLPECLREACQTSEIQVTRLVGGQNRILGLRVSNLMSLRGQPRGRLILMQDVTEPVEAHIALRQLNRSLQAQNEELDAFGHTVAHDLKGPLGIIVGFAELLTDESSGLSEAEKWSSLQIILQTARRMDRIVEELMLLAGLRRMEARMERLNMGEIIATVLNRLSTMLRDASAKVILPPSWPIALGYAPWVEEVWMNYMTNAIKYGGRPLRIELGATLQEDQTVRFWIRDNGPGLTVEEQGRLFQPFERLDSHRATGHGLGLSVVRRIVEKMGGTVGVESSGISGEGSTFSFTLPVALGA